MGDWLAWLCALTGFALVGAGFSAWWVRAEHERVRRNEELARQFEELVRERERTLAREARIREKNAGIYGDYIVERLSRQLPDGLVFEWEEPRDHGRPE